MVIFNLRRIRLIFLIFIAVFCVIYILQAKWFWKFFYPWPYRKEITAAADCFQLDPCLIAALIRVESGFNPRAQSDAGARGLMQVMPNTARWAAGDMGFAGFHPDLLYQPEVSLLIGCWYLADLIREFNGNLVASLAAYNAGRGNVKAWLVIGQWKGTTADLDKIPFSETRIYVKAVLRNYEMYKYLYSRA